MQTFQKGTSFRFDIQYAISFQRNIWLNRYVEESQHHVHPLNIERNCSSRVNKYFCHQSETQALFTWPVVATVWVSVGPFGLQVPGNVAVCKERDAEFRDVTIFINIRIFRKHHEKRKDIFAIYQVR